MLYPKKSEKSLSKDLFKNPTSEYRGAPFWAWNCKLDERLLKTQIECFKQMGLGGFHIHSRTGLTTKYLGEKFMEMVKSCVDKAEKENMLAWLYDEDNCPSGFAGGLVTKDPRFRQRKLVFTANVMNVCVPKETASQTGEPFFLACYDISLNKNGELAQYAKIDPEKQANSDKWYAYVTTDEPKPQYNNQTYVDTLSKRAIDKFIEITYEAYKKAVGDKFGSVVPAIFTDEPQFARKTALSFAESKENVTLPWTGDLGDTFIAEYGIDIVDFLPELIWELPENKISRARYLYHDHVAERFAAAFADNCGKWCEENNIMLTGHMLDEPSLHSQTTAIGEAMRSYRSFQLPGIDILRNSVELTSAKQAQSACHQYGREGVMSELYGVTNWDFDFRGHKFQGDWQAALGVTMRVPHLSWVSMAGNAKRDFPASISYQSPWYKEYPYIENHFARVNAVLTRGKPVVKVGVIHPIESYWLHLGPNKNTGAVRERLESNFSNITRWLLCGNVDFDFISESLLPDLCPKASNPLKVGAMEYETIIVPGCETLRRTTVERLERFKKNGGRLIFAGECPEYIDAEPSNSLRNLYDTSEAVPFCRINILSALEDVKLIDIRNSDGTTADNLIYNMRGDNDCKWLFIANIEKSYTRAKSYNRGGWKFDKAPYADVVVPQKITLKVKGKYVPSLYDTINGEMYEIDYTIENGNTFMKAELYCHDSLLFRLGENTNAKKLPPIPEKIDQIDFKHKVSYMREEQNVLLLDLAEYAFDGGQWQDTEEILRIGEKFRKKLGFPCDVQPWTLDDEPLDHRVTLRFRINSETVVENPVLAIEDAERLEINLNGVDVVPEITGYYVDEAIKTIKLPAIKEGENVLTVKIPFGRTANIEYCYILGEFNVKVEGCEKTITPATDTIGFGSITNQGMPFYGGNITYKVKFETDRRRLIVVKASNYRGALIKVFIDGEPIGVIAYAPYKIRLDDVAMGAHEIEFKLFGNRYNTFGQLHNADESLTWYDADSWRTEDDAWCYEYKLKDTGIMTSPVIEMLEC